MFAISPTGSTRNPSWAGRQFRALQPPNGVPSSSGRYDHHRARPS
jgi:hypothetical protein